jgi:hypothetical protein
MSFQAIRAACVAVALVFACAGCSYSRFDLPGQVGRYNDSIEEFIEKAILLNIVRASHDAPIGFTQVAVVRGSGSVGGQLGLPSVTFGPGQTLQQQQIAFGANAATVGGNTNFDLAVLESKEFWLGLLTPLGADTLAFFIRQGVPREILFYLYVQRVEVTSDNKTDILTNNPLDSRFVSFTTNLRDSLRLGLTVDTASRSFDFGPPLPAAQATNIKDLIELAKAGLSLRPVANSAGSQYQVQATVSASVLCFDQARATVNILDEIAPESTCAVVTGHGPAPAQTTTAGAPFAFNHTSARGPATIKIFPRSTYDIFRYLGALVHAGEAARSAPYVDLVTDEAKSTLGPDPLSTKLFVVQKNAPGNAKYLSVKYGNDTYSVPKNATTTIQVLALLRQLIALSTSVNALPQTGTVTTVVK